MRSLYYQLYFLLSVISFGMAMETSTKKNKEKSHNVSRRLFCEKEEELQKSQFRNCSIRLLVGKVRYCLFFSLGQEVSPCLIQNILNAIEGAMPNQQYCTIKGDLKKILKELLGDSLYRSDATFTCEKNSAGITLLLDVLIDFSFKKSLESLVDEVIHITEHPENKVRRHPLFSVIYHDVQGILGTSYQIDSVCLSEIVVMVAEDMGWMAGEVSYKQFLYAVVLEQIFHECTLCPENMLVIPSELFMDGHLSYEYFGKFIDGNDVGSPEIGASFVPIIPLLLSEHSHLKEQLSLQQLELLWDWASYADSMRCYDGIYRIMSEKTKGELTRALHSLSKAIMKKGGNLEKEFAQSLSYYGVTRSMRALFEYGASLYDNFMHDVVGKPLEWLDGEHYDNIYTMYEFNDGLEKTMRASVLYSPVHLKEPTMKEAQCSINRLVAVAILFKRLKVLVPRDVFTLIYSKDLSLAQDVFNAFWATHEKERNKSHCVLIKRRLLTNGVLKALMKKRKAERLQELLLVENEEGETPLDCYRVEVDQWEEIFKDESYYEFVGLSLLDPEKVEQNFCEEIERSVEMYYKKFFGPIKR